MNIGIIGLGLIGGSMAKDLKSQLCVKVIGMDASKAHETKALELNLVDRLASIDEILTTCDIVILAIPVNVVATILPQLLDTLDPQAVLIDVGSTKAIICDSVRQHPKRGRFVAAHPLAGTEYSGPEAALKGLFAHKKNIICEAEYSDTDALSKAQALFESLGMTHTFMNAIEHDKHLAYISHLSHVSSFVLGLTVLDIEKDEKHILNLASTGFASTVRLAKSNPKTWSAIFSNNKQPLIEAIDKYSYFLQVFKKALEDNDISDLEGYMSQANNIKKILN